MIIKGYIIGSRGSLIVDINGDIDTFRTTHCLQFNIVKMVKSPETEHPLKAVGWATRDWNFFLPFKFSRKATEEHDVKFKVLYCGVFHSDLHITKNEWGFTQYPLVPGHEIVGQVTEVGSKVEAETRSEPDLSLVSLAFLWASMNGPSELAIVDEANNKATTT
ncbi:unnamed protein product [Fraxinus pennsylvanica]|uniref:Alcohol dehydrogenase-like N-terminal domain-containing protein n=1 Tax=Fraxinus pennsylvanica TaxID=56036 RepID=A0AAD1Z039_9LAMI|nr:unnamed protein product [Fraxinus pennsylvanica]